MFHFFTFSARIDHFPLFVNIEDISSLGGSSTTLPNHLTLNDEDVHQEENSIRQAARAGRVEDGIAVQLRGLAKTYPKQMKINCKRFCFCCCYCKCKMKKSFDAVRVRNLLHVYRYNAIWIKHSKLKGQEEFYVHYE